MKWKVVYARHALKDAKKASSGGLRPKIEALIEVIARDPFASPPPFEKLVGDLSGAYSRRINILHRLVYQVLPESRTVKILRMWSQHG